MTVEGDATGVEVTKTTARSLDEANLNTTQLQQETASPYWDNILESIGDGFWVFNGEWCCTYINNRQAQLVGMPKEDVLGKNAWELFPDLVGSEVYNQLHHAVATQTPVHFEHCSSTWQGWFELRVYPSANGVSILTVDITERKETQEALQDRQNLVQQLAEMSPGLLYLYDVVEQRNIYINERSLELLGYPAETVLAMGTHFMTQVMHPDDLAQMPTHFERLNTSGNGSFIELEYRMRQVNGEWRWFSTRDTVFSRTAQGQIRQILGTAQDITERKRAEEALRESEERFQAFMHHSPASAWIADEQGRLLYLSPTYFRMFQFPVQDAVGKNIFEIYPAEFAQQFIDNNKRVFETKQVIETIETAPRPDGSVGEFLVYKFPIPSGEEILLGGVALDITERRRGEEALRDSEQQLKIALQTAKLGSWQHDFVTGKLSCSDQCKANFGLPPDAEFSHETLFAALHPNDRKPVQAAIQQAIEERTEYEVEERCFWPDGSLHWLIARGRLVYDSDGTPVRMVGVTLDITDVYRQATEQMRTQEALETNLAQLEAVLHSMTDGLIIVDPQGTILTFNPAALALHGFESMAEVHQHLQGMAHLFEAWELDGQPISFTDWPISRAIAGETFSGRRIHVRRTDTGKYWVGQYGGTPVRNKAGENILAIVTISDITAQYTVEKALRESEERLQLAQRAAKIGTWDWNVLNDDVLWSEGIWNLLGLEPNHTKPNSETWIRFIHPDDRPRIIHHLEVAFTQDEEYYDEFRIIQPDGSIRWLASIGRIIRNTNAQVERMLGINLDITDRKQAEAEKQQLLEQIRTEREFLEAVLQQMPAGVMVAEAPSGKIILSNERIKQIWRIPELLPTENVEGTQEVYQGFHSDGRPYQQQDWPLYRSVRTGEVVTEEEITILRDDGTQGFILVNSAPIRDQQGNIKAGVVTFYDISDRKQTEEALRKSERLYRAIGETIDYGIWVCESDGRNMYASESFLRLVGLTQEQCSEFGWGDVLHPDDVQRTIAAWKDCVRSGNFWDIEHRFRGVDGEWHPILARGVPVRDENGEIICWAGINLDISGLKRTELQLRESEERFRLATRAVDGVVYDWDIQTGRVYRSEGLYRLIGISPEEAPETREWWTQRIHPDDMARLQSVGDSLLTGSDDRFEVEYRVCHEDGRWIDVWDCSYLIRNGNGQIIRIVGSSTDISDRKRAEVEREQLLVRERAAREEAEEANRLKDEFLAVLSHELRSPLNPILGWTRMLRTRKFDEKATDRALETIERNAKLQTQLIEDLLDVSRILRGKMVLNICPVNLATTIEAALETVRLAASAKEIQIQTVLDTPIGHVSGDPNRLQQVIWNLLSNAVKFTPAKGWVEVRLERVGCEAQIQVRDNGLGISPEFLPHVFDYFRQADGTTTRKFGGLGLGLAIVRHLVELHGGSVWAESPGEGLGTTFTVRLPLMKTAPKAPQQVLSQNWPDLNGLHVLVVDDEADIRSLIAFILEQAGAEVTVAKSAAEALAALNSSVPDVLLCDIGMPDVDGYMLMRQLRAMPAQRGGQIRAIALTAYAGESDQQQALDAGFQLHIAKPVEPEELVRAIANLMATDYN